MNRTEMNRDTSERRRLYKIEVERLGATEAEIKEWEMPIGATRWYLKNHWYISLSTIEKLVSLFPEIFDHQQRARL